MKTKSNGVAVPTKDTRDAAEEQSQRSTIRRIVREELRGLLARLVTDERSYSTRPGCWPEGYSRDTWRSLARRIGVRRGRWYVVTHAQLEAHERGEPAPVTPRPSTSWSPAEAADGLRLVGSGR